MDALEAQLAERGGELTRQVAEASQALQNAMTNTATIAETIAIEIPRIEETLQAENVKAQVGGLAEIGQQAAKEIEALVEGVKPENTGQAAALEYLKTATSDNQITANETAKVAAALQTLNSVIGTQMGTAATNTDKLIQTIATMQRRLDDQQRLIGQLQSGARGSGN